MATVSLFVGFMDCMTALISKHELESPSFVLRFYLKTKLTVQTSVTATASVSHTLLVSLALMRY